MTRIDVSVKRFVVAKFVALLAVIILSGRIMINDPNIIYRYLGAVMFAASVLRSVMLIVYMQYRSQTGWSNEVDIPD